MSIGFQIVQQEAAERAMARYRARKAREARERAVRPSVSQPTTPNSGHGARKLSREEALQLIAKKSPRGAWKLLAGYLNGVPTRRSN